MEKVTAIRDFPGSTINRDELGLVTKGTELEVTGNDAAYLEREGYAERVADEAPSEPATPAPPAEESKPAEESTPE